MSYVLNESLKEYKNKRRTEKARTTLTKTTLMTPLTVGTSKTKHQNKA